MRTLSSAPAPIHPPNPTTISSNHGTPNSSPQPSDTEPFSLHAAHSDDDSSTYRLRPAISYRSAPLGSNGERDHLLPPPAAYSANGLPLPSVAASAGQSRADRFHGVAILLITVLVLLVLTLHQHLSPSIPPLHTSVTTRPHQHNPHAHSHTHSHKTSTTIDPSALFDEGNDVTVLYHPVIVNALPYTTLPIDSTVTTIHLHTLHSDHTSSLYPLCTFSRVCATPSELLLTIASNYSVWVYYNTVLPYCRDVLYRRLEVCGCFHGEWRVGLLPWRRVLGEEERVEGERVGRGMVEAQFGGLADWTRGWEQVGPARTIPTVDELRDMQWLQQPNQPSDSDTTSWVGRARSSLSTLVSPTFSSSSSSSAPSSTPALYPDPFSAPLLSTPPAHTNTTTTTTTTNLTLHYYHHHYWSIQKWVVHHHIAHWAQKLLVAYTSLTHYSHACHHAYRRLALNGSLDRLTPLVHRARLEACVGCVAEYVDSGGRVGEVVEGEVWESGVWGLECMEPVVGMVFHDTYEPVTEHMQHILAITVEAMQDSITGLDDSETQHPHTHQSTTTTNPPRIHHLYPPTTTTTTTTTQPPPSFSTANNLYTNALFHTYPPNYHDRPRDMPPPANHTVLSCFRRLSFSPLYGTFARSGYDLQGWRERAMRHYGIERHQPHYSRDILIPLQPSHNHTTSPYLPHPLTPLPPAARVDHAVLATLTLMTCPPPRAVFVTRPDRAVVNLQAVVDRLRERFGVGVEAVSVDGSTPSAEQARLFAGAGLLLSAHSSQMVNVLFSGANSVMIEVTAEFYNVDFFNYARSVGVRFLYALGGTVSGWEDEGEAMRVCVKELKERCGSSSVAGSGDGYCVEGVAAEVCKEKRHFPNKHKAFEADVDAVERSVREGLRHLMHACHGRWGNAQLATRT